MRAGAAGSFKTAGVDQDVSVGDAIKTGRDALAKLVLGDETSITIDEETEIEVDRWLVGGREPSQIELISGHVRTVVGEKFGGRTRMELITPTSVIGVKGTEWLTWWVPSEMTTWVCVVTGLVAASGREELTCRGSDCSSITSEIRSGAPRRRSPGLVADASAGRSLRGAPRSDSSTNSLAPR